MFSRGTGPIQARSSLPALGQPLHIPLKSSTNFVYSSVDDVVALAFVTIEAPSRASIMIKAKEGERFQRLE
jgi:hypothetical protein